MPIQVPQWTEFLSCPICYNEFDDKNRKPISLGCSHTVCKTCLSKLHRKQCPFDQANINVDISKLPVNFALLQLVGTPVPDNDSVSNVVKELSKEDTGFYYESKKCMEDLALFLKPFSAVANGSGNNMLSRPMQRKLVTLINCQLVEEEGRSRAMRAARSLGERTVTELILLHQNPQQLSANLWAAVRARGCQFLGPAMQEEVLKLILLALEDGPALSRKVLVMFVVQRLEPVFSQASKTSIGHVVQLLYRASCFKVSKREGDSSLMQLKEEFRTYEALRREHDAQIVQIATEAGLRIAPDQWSSLLYGDTVHKSHMQSIIDKLQTPQSFAASVMELVIALQRTGDPGNLSCLRPSFELLSAIDPSPDAPIQSWADCCSALKAAIQVVKGLVDFIQFHGSNKVQDSQQFSSAKYKTSLCRDLIQKGTCPRGTSCTFAHSGDEMEKYRMKNRKMGNRSFSEARDLGLPPTSQMGQSSLRIDDGHGNRAPIMAGSSVNVFCSKGIIYSPTVPSEQTVSMQQYDGYNEKFMRQPTFPQAGFIPRHPVPPSGAPVLPGMNNRLISSAQMHRPLPPGCQDYFLRSGAVESQKHPVYDDHNARLMHHHQPHSVDGRKMYSVSHLTKPEHIPMPWECADGAKVPGSQQFSASQSLAALKHRKQEILEQLDRVKNRSDTSVVPNPTPIASSTGHIGAVSDGAWSEANAMRSYPDMKLSIANRDVMSSAYQVSYDDQFIPFGPKIVSKYGPISRTVKTMGYGSVPIQASSAFDFSTLPTPVVRRPVPVASPVPSLYPQPQSGIPKGPYPYMADTYGYTDQRPYNETPVSQLPEYGWEKKNIISDQDRMKLELRHLEQQINTLKIAAETDSFVAGAKLTRELEFIEKGIREVQTGLRQTNNNNWLDSSRNPNWKYLNEMHKPSVNDEEVYEQQVAEDMEKAERLWLYELEQDEQEWRSNKSDAGADTDTDVRKSSCNSEARFVETSQYPEVGY